MMTMTPYDTLVLKLKTLKLPLQRLNQTLESQEYTDILLSAKMLSQKLTEILNEVDGQSIKLQWIKETSNV